MRPGWVALQEGHPSDALIRKPCMFAVKPGCDRRATANPKVPGTCTREAGLDGALGKESGALSEGWPGPSAANACSHRM